MSQIIFAARCNWCSRFSNPSDLLPFPSGQQMCRRCFEWHYHALGILSGDTPRGCQECGLTMAQLNVLSLPPTTRMYGAEAYGAEAYGAKAYGAKANGALRMYVVPKDGIYAVLCLTCKEDYCRKRADLYRGTAFGQELKL